MEFDVVIAGSGLVGSALALALRRAELRIAVIEPRPPQVSAEYTGWDHRIYAVSPGSAAFLERLGIWQAIDQTRVCQVEEMRIFGDAPQAQLGFSAYAAGLSELAFIVENRELLSTAWRALLGTGDLEVVAGIACASLSIDKEFARIELADGRILHARLIVGADGADSWVRSQVAVEVDVRDYEQTAVVANFAVARPHRGVACQWFRTDGVLALLPLPGERVSMVWSTAEAHAARLLQCDGKTLAKEVGAACGGMLGEFELLGQAAAFPLRLQRVRRLALPRVALVGDAAHCVHPLAGQGVNLGFRDARELAQVLAGRGAQHDCGDLRLLRRYERARREDVLLTQLVTDTLQRMFGSDSTWVARLRNLGLNLTDRQSYLKNLLVQHAVG